MALNTHAIAPEFIISWLETLGGPQALEVIQDLIRHNPMQNLNIAVQAAVKLHAVIGDQECIKLFESVGNFHGLFLFLGSIANNTDDPKIVLK